MEQLFTTLCWRQTNTPNFLPWHKHRERRRAETLLPTAWLTRAVQTVQRGAMPSWVCGAAFAYLGLSLQFLCVYRWRVGPWMPTECPVSCGPGGTRKRDVLCVIQTTPSITRSAKNRLCDRNSKPSGKETCNSHPCPLGMWLEGPWNPVGTIIFPWCLPSQ